MFLYHLKLAFLGTSFGGWQSQKNTKAIQDELKNAFKIILRQDKFFVLGLNRTDAGVHAWCYHAYLRCENEINELKVLRSLNGILTDDIRCFEIEKVQEIPPEQKAKVYRYSVFCGIACHPFFQGKVWHIYKKPNLEMLKKEFKIFEGTHDFSAFCASDSSAKTKVRTILKTKLIVHKLPDFEDCYVLEFWLQGTGFLKQMVRSIVGTLLLRACLSEDKKLLSMDEIILKKNRKLAGKTAPAQGLTLMHVDFEGITTLENVIKKFQVF